MERIEGVTDLHSHLLPGIDDGARDLAAAVQMARMAAGEGIQTVVATPHTLDGVYNVEYSHALSARDLLVVELAKEGIGVDVRVASEVHLHEGIPDLLEREPRISLDGERRYLLLELPNRSLPPALPNFLFGLRARGTTPIIAHPERIMAVRENADVTAEWIRIGALLQVTSGALVGTFGKVIGACARQLLELGRVHFLATDAHSPHRRPFQVQETAKTAIGLVGEEGARKLLVENPASVLRGDSPDSLTAPGPRRRRKYSLPGART